MHSEHHPTKEILKHYDLQVTDIQQIKTGLVNSSYLVNTDSAKQYVLQCVNPIFPKQINDNIALLTTHLRRQGMLTPELISTQDGAHIVQHGEEIWRLLNYIDGDVRQKLAQTEMAESAGSLLGKFHTVLFDLQAPIENYRGNVHDLDRHLDFLKQSLERQTKHPKYIEIFALGEEVLSLATQLDRPKSRKIRVIHGDPKISNIIFAKNSYQALCLIDLDTVSQAPLHFDLGDAMRSWCNPNGEDSAEGQFSLTLFEAAISGYASHTGTYIDETEWRDIVPATQSLFIELAARFCADALNESYFAWDKEQFSSHSQHNIVRTRGQLSAAKSLAYCYEQAAEIVQSAFN